MIKTYCVVFQYRIRYIFPLFLFFLFFSIACIGGTLQTDNPVKRSEGNLPAIFYLLRGASPDICAINSIYVATNGATTASGSLAEPLDTIARAKARIRQMKSDGVYPESGLTVCIRGGVYFMTEPIIYSDLDSGEKFAPVVYRNYPDETVVLSGSTELDPQWFTPVTDSDLFWDRLVPEARSHIVKVDLAAHGITDYGTLVPRGYEIYNSHSPMELSINEEMMHLARWPNRNESDPQNQNAPALVTGTLNPDITGTFEYTGNSAQGNADDGYPNYRRVGEVNNIQYYLYHCTWQDGGAKYWFISAYDPQTNANCWPTGEFSDFPSWQIAAEEVIPPMEPFKDSAGMAIINNRPEDFKEHGFVRIPEVISSPDPNTPIYHFRFPGARYTRWENAGDIWVQGLLGRYWSDDTRAVTLSGDIVQLAGTPSAGLNTTMPFFVFNLLEEIDVPGEYYIDRNTGSLYLYPPLTMRNIRLSLLDDALLQGDNVEHVQFVGLNLELSRGDLVHFENSRHLLFEEMTMRNNGGTAIRLSGSYNKVIGGQIFGNGGAGVEISGGSRPNLTPGNNEVRNCEIHNYARWDRTYKAAVRLNGVGNRASHNYIHDAPHFGIYFFGNNHIIEYNRIERIAQQANDVGAIYTGRDWGYRGNVIRFNYLKDIDSIFGGSHGVYLDDGASGITIFGNIFNNINGYGVLSGGGRDNIFTNNIFVSAQLGAFSSDRRVVREINNVYRGGRPQSWNLLGRLKINYDNKFAVETIAYQADPWASAYPQLALIPNDFDIMMAEPGWREPHGCVFGENISWRTDRLIVDGSWGGNDASDFFARITPNIDNTNPLFVDESGDNLNLRPNSPAFTLNGFTAIPFNDIGLLEK